MSAGHLLILGCSARKVTDRGSLPALELYDGVNYRVLRRFLNDHGWPPGLIVKVISAQYGLIDATDIIEPYDVRMHRELAAGWRPSITRHLRRIGDLQSAFVNVGANYYDALPDMKLLLKEKQVIHARGGIGSKMKAMKQWLNGLKARTARFPGQSPASRSYLYFFPDWDDYVDEPFTDDETPKPTRKAYAHEIFGNSLAYDGLLVSLAQLHNKKGALYRVHSKPDAATPLRSEMRLPPSLLLFGDCGAFSYAARARPPFSPKEAAELYETYGFDIGASVDHIPLREISWRSDEGSIMKKNLSVSTRRRRVRLSLDNAEEFLSIWAKRHYTFTPVAVIHGLSVKSYVSSLNACLDMGYQHLAIGGLVPLSDREIMRIVAGVRCAIQNRTRGDKENIWLHLLGILRPKLQPLFRSLGVSSFDSASYMRKAWLRSDQNYLARDGKTWHGSLRVPFSDSTAMRQAADARGWDNSHLVELENACLTAIRYFNRKGKGATRVLKAVAEYGPLLERKHETNHFEDKHKVLLRDRPWEECECPICSQLGVDVAVFRGAARNKRRGLHNTWVFYQTMVSGNRPMR